MQQEYCTDKERDRNRETQEVLGECDLDASCGCTDSAQFFTYCHASEGGLDGDS